MEVKIQRKSLTEFCVNCYPLLPVSSVQVAQAPIHFHLIYVLGQTKPEIASKWLSFVRPFSVESELNSNGDENAQFSSEKDKG